MPDVFTKEYVRLYDAMYADKDYAFESSWVSEIVQKHGIEGVSRLLDVGCGTGRHAVLFSQAGFEVTGLDRSPQMLEVAAARATDSGVDLELHPGSIETFTLESTFDITVMLFSVIGYLTTNESLLQGLTNVRRHMEPGGLLVFDYWYGPAVLKLRPEPRLLEKEVESETLLRFSSGTLDEQSQVVSIHMDLLRLAGQRLIGRTQEDHSMRYFFPQELRLLLDASGFRIQDESAFPDTGSGPNDSSWSAAVVAVAV